MKHFVFVFTLFLLFPFFAQASEPAPAPTVFISEIAWAGSATSTSDEWVEICGAAGTDLGDWTIEGASANRLVIPAGSLIPESGAFLISNYDHEDAKSTLASTTHDVTTSIALSNTQSFLLLRDRNDLLIDSAGASGTPPLAGTSGGLKASMSRRLPLQNGNTAEAWITSATSSGFDAGASELGTPGTCPESAAASIPTTAENEPAPPVVAETLPTPPASTALLPTTAVRISEIYPAPRSGEQEWIELVNPSGIGEVLDGWTIEDGKGTATALAGVLLPWDRLVIPAPKGSLNNAGDLVLLKDAQSRTIDGLAYGDWDTAFFPHVGGVAKGEAVMRLELQESYAVTTLPTPKAANVLVAPASHATEPSSSTPPPSSNLSASTLPTEPRIPGTIIPAIASIAANTLEIPIPKKDSSVASQPQNDKKKSAPGKSKNTAPRYKGSAYSGAIAIPPGVYSKTRMYILRDNALEELRLSKSTSASLVSGQRIAFVGQSKEDGGTSFLLANPNSIRPIGEAASNTFANIEQWPAVAGSYRFVAELTLLRAGGAEVRLNGTEGDVLLPKSAGALKPGDLVEIQGFVAPGARPRIVIPGMDSFRLHAAAPVQPANQDLPRLRLPWLPTAALTSAAAIAGIVGYLRNERLKRLALLAQPLEEEA